MTGVRLPAVETVDRGIAAAVDGLFALRRADGSWQGTLPSSAVSTGSAVIALHLAADSGELVVRGAGWLRETQAADGGWGDAPDGPSTLNATAIAVAALQLVQPERSVFAVTRGLARIGEFGGMAAVEDKTLCTLKAVCQQYLALAGLYDAARIDRMPLELVLLPRRLRQRLSFTVPGLMSWGVMQARTRRTGPLRRRLDRLAEPKALRYLADIHAYESSDPDRPGGVEESALMASIVCVGLVRAGVGLDLAHDYVRYLRATVRADGSWPVDRDIEFSVSMYVAQGLRDAGVDRAELAGTADWIRRCQRPDPFPPTGAPAGGWGWSLPSGWPDTDDTACAVGVLAQLGGDEAALRKGVDWLRTMQNRDGSWGCFASNAGVSMDSPCSVMTAHAVLGLNAAGGLPGEPALAKAVRWFARTQRSDGAFANIWFRGNTAGTARVLDALGQLGLAGTATAVGCRDWLLAHQHEDGGWGDGVSAPPSVEETAWAVLGLIAAGQAGSAAVRAGVAWLLARQRPDGRWPATFVGIYFLGLTYWCDHIADGFALQALGRYRAGAA